VTRQAADALWGAEAVDAALAELAPAPTTPELERETRAYLASPGTFRTWALAQPWPRFCAIVRIVSGAALSEVMGHDG